MARSRLRRNTRGSVLLEFAFSAVVILMTMMTAIEFGVELFVRQSMERAGSQATSFYSHSRSVSETEANLGAEGPGLLSLCLEPVEVQLYNHVAGATLAGNSGGFVAQDNPGDNSAEAARVTLTCRWSRLTPFIRAMMGPEMVYVTRGFVRMRD